MNHLRQYPPQYPFDAICFDCDNTLSNAEGIDELAKLNNVADEVKTLTEMAMSHEDISLELYQKRLEITKPTFSQFDTLASLYIDNTTEDAQQVIQTLLSLNKKVFVLSAGNDPAVTTFASHLGIPSHQVFAVNVFFDQNGEYLGFDQSSPMTQRAGKRHFIQKIKQQHPRILHIGDGNNDLAVKPDIDLFVGYGGSVRRNKVEQASDAFIHSLSLLPLLPLALHESEVNTLSDQHQQNYQKALALFDQHVTLASHFQA